MDGREGMAMPGAASYYIHHRGITGPGSTNQPGLHGAPSTTRPMSSSPPPSLPVSSPATTVGGQRGTVGSGFQVESPTSISLHGVVVGGGPGSGQGMPVKKKRGRPRKYGPDGTVALAISPMSSTSPGSGSGSGSGSGMRSGGSGSVSASGSAGSVKRGRGRPPGTGRKQQLASLGEWVAGSAGMAFTPHVIMISVGEDIATKIMSFSQQGPRAICILSANGAVSTVTLRQPATSGGTVTYEGRFEILSLSGSYLVTDDGGSRSRSGGLSISLSSPDGRVIGGGVGGLLIAASHVQVIVGSFMYGGSKAKNRIKAGQEPQESDHAVGDKQSTLSSGTLPNQGHPSSTLMGGWHSSRQMEMGNAHIDINLTRG